MREENDQGAAIAFLSDAAEWPAGAGPIERHETHGAIVFLGGGLALKIKRAVKLPYLDFSTLAIREATLRRELELNRPQAPGLYLDVVAITRDADGRLRIDGAGTPVEWALKMRRFPQEALLLSIVERGAMSEELATALADRIAAYHAAAARPAHARERLLETVGALIGGLKASGDAPIAARADTLEALFATALASTSALRTERCATGLVRRCHGDLHLANIVVLDGVPTLFDALEFDEDLATIDPLYDLAFVLMDLDRHGAGRHAAVLLDRYLALTHDARDQASVGLMPLFLAARATVRAVVAIDRLKAKGMALGPVDATLDHAERYLRLPAGIDASGLFATP